MTATVNSEWEVVRHVNGRPWSRRQIGWYTVEEPRDVPQWGEYAADFWTSRVEAGRYPLYAFKDCGTRWHSLGVTMPATIVSGSWWNKLHPGDPRPVCVHPRQYSLAKSILDGEAPHIELFPGVEARPIPFEYNGKEQLTYGLFCGAEQF